MTARSWQSRSHFLCVHLQGVLRSHTEIVQVEGLLDRINGQPPVIEYIVEQFENLGYSSWAHRIINTASVSDRAPFL